MISTIKDYKEFKHNLITLSFVPEIEKDFLQEYFNNSIKHIRMAMLIAIIFYSLFGILDAFIVPEVKHKIWIIRYAIFAPFVLLLYIFSFSKHFKKCWQLCLASIILVAGLGIIQMVRIASFPGSYLYYTGLILVFIYGYTFFKLRFIWATAAGWIIVISYELSAGLLMDTPIYFFLNNNFFFLSGNFIGMFACYSIELHSRNDFIKTRLLKAEKRKVSASNHELEKRVRERTEQLVIINQNLKNEVEEKQIAEKTARESELKFKCLSENSPEIIYTLDCDGRYNYVNPAWTKILGHDTAEVVGQYFIDFALKEDVNKYIRIFKRIRNNQETVTDVISSLIHKDGYELLFNLSGAPNFDSKGRVLGMVGIMKDITEQHKLQTKLIQAQKMEALGTLAGGVAHDFNNILSGIIGYSELAAMDISENSELKNKISHVLKASQRAKELVNQILSFSRQGEDSFKPLEISIIAKEVTKLLRASLPSNIEIHQNIETNLSFINAVPTQIHQLFMNLCTNAAAAMEKEGGVLEISIIDKKLSTSQANRKLDLEPGNYIVLIIKDSGHGMTPEILERIFDPYFTTKEKGKGTGLGMAVVHGIVKRHHGGITIESRPGVGTTFSVYFPAADLKLNSERIDTCKTLPKGDECILFVDDEKDILDSGSQMLSRLGYDVITQSDSVDTLNLFKKQPDKFDLVITDMTMPKLSGEKLAIEMMKIRPDIPIILCTGFSERIDKDMAQRIGIREFSIKPIGLRELAESTRKVLDNSSF